MSESGSTWRLNCCIIGKKPLWHVVGVRIQSTDDIGELRHLIKECMKPHFDGIPENRLRVWKVSINLVGLST
jgi:hypothetical protein